MGCRFLAHKQHIIFIQESTRLILGKEIIMANKEQGKNKEKKKKKKEKPK